MASSSPSPSHLLLAICILSVLPLLSSARPCKTLFISYSVDVDPTPVRYFSVYRVVYRPIIVVDEPHPHPHPHTHPHPHPHRGLVGPAGSAEWASLIDSARDILAVVAALLFGLGCGAIAAAAAFLVWSLLTGQHQICSDEESDADDYEYAAADSPKKKTGYVKMAAVEPLLAAPAKEGYEGK